MREDYVFFMVERNRTRVIQLAESCPADKRDEVPQGFKNNLRWHLGHVLVVTDNFMNGLAGSGKRLPEAYQANFGNGTKPADWTADTPDWDTIIAKLKDQLEQVKSDFAGKLDQPVPESFTKAETAGDVLFFATNHESNHLGNMNAMLKLLV